MLRAIIFDCDGVIADTEPLHLSAFQHVLREHGIDLSSEEYYRDYLALDDRGCFTKVHEDRGLEMTAASLSALMAEKARHIESLMATGLKPFPGVTDFIHSASKKYALAVASGALNHEVEHVLRKAEVRDCFKVVVAAEHVSNGKPHPEPFLRACTLLSSNLPDGLSPTECLVIEDSIHGVRAAHLAGMRCLAVTTSYSADRLSDADLVVENLAGLSFEKLEALFQL